MGSHTKTYIKIDNNWFRDEKYIQKAGKLAFTVYTLLLERIGCNDRVYFNIDYLISHIGMNKNNCHMVNRIKKALLSLEECKLITFHPNMYDDEEVELGGINVTKNTGLYASIESPTEKYTIIYMHEVFAILFSDLGDYHAKIGMLSQFCYIISCINSSHNVSFPSMANIIECSTVGSYKTLKDHLDKLVELNLLVYRNPNIMKKNGSKLTQTPNYYARPMHEHDLEAIVEEKVAKMNRTPMSQNAKELSTLMRSLTQKMRNYRKKEKAGTVTEEDMISLYEDVEAYNQLCISSGKKPRFDINAKPEVIEINMDGVESITLDIASNSLKLNKLIEPFKEKVNDTSHEPFDDEDWTF